MEYYESSGAQISRIFPIFFGSRNDVFGQIGNLFKHEHYTKLPRLKPQASIELAAKLLRENGIEPRPQMFAYTVADIVDSMKRLLGVFAWNIDNPDHVTSECVSEMLAVVRSALKEKKPTNMSKEVPAGNLSESPSTEQGNDMNHNDLWTLIHNEKCVRDMTALQEYLEHLGVCTSEDLIDCEKEYLNGMSEYMKPIQQKKLLRCSRIF